VRQVCTDWSRQSACAETLNLDLRAAGQQVVFEPDHLRRVLVNLLDNALRYASRIPGAICVTTEAATSARPGLRVWSDGQPLEHSVQRHLFEPFFSSESRSSGLGLYICRELCERHGALIGYQRAERQRQDVPTPGNEFFVAFRADTTEQAAAPSFATIGS
jgi:two-component system sensor histidine kinase PilS (NtrC family)